MKWIGFHSWNPKQTVWKHLKTFKMWNMVTGTLPETNIFAPEKRPGPKRTWIIFQPLILRGYLSFREGTCFTMTIFWMLLLMFPCQPPDVNFAAFWGHTSVSTHTKVHWWHSWLQTLDAENKSHASLARGQDVQTKKWRCWKLQKKKTWAYKSTYHVHYHCFLAIILFFFSYRCFMACRGFEPSVWRKKIGPLGDDSMMFIRISCVSCQILWNIQCQSCVLPRLYAHIVL